MQSAVPTAGSRATDQAAIPTDLALGVKLRTLTAEDAAPIPRPLLLATASALCGFIFLFVVFALAANSRAPHSQICNSLARIYVGLAIAAMACMGLFGPDAMP
jgi:hypothetical protein